MIKLKTTFCALAFVLVLTASAHADNATSDVGAVAKDDAAQDKYTDMIAKDRAAKAQDKASGNWAGQAVDSITLGYDHVMHSEKGAEKSTDQNILNHDTTSGQ